MCHPPAGAGGCAATGSKLRRRPSSAASSRIAAGRSANRSRATVAGVLHPPGMDLEPAVAFALGELDDALQEGGPHVELHFLGHTQVPVEEIGEAIAAARPRLDREAHPIARAL